MKEFDELCRSVEQLDKTEYDIVLRRESARVMPALRSYCDDAMTGSMLFAAFLIGSIRADGKLDEAEYDLMAPALVDFFGPDFDYEAAKSRAKLMRKSSKEMRFMHERLAAILLRLDDELKNSIIFVSLLICAVDGKISAKEKEYIKRLVG